jgi:hypothetical protein
MDSIQCRYCKQTGHYKNKCPKLAGKPPFNNNKSNDSRSNDHRYNNNRRYNDRNSHTPQETVKPVDPKIAFESEFPSLGGGGDARASAGDASVGGWGGSKSFVDIVKEEKVVVSEVVEEDEYDVMKMEILSK